MSSVVGQINDWMGLCFQAMSSLFNYVCNFNISKVVIFDILDFNLDVGIVFWSRVDVEDS